VRIHRNSIEIWLQSKCLTIVLHIFEINNEKSKSNKKFITTLHKQLEWLNRDLNKIKTHSNSIQHEQWNVKSNIKFIPIKNKSVIVHVCFALFTVCLCICVCECLLQKNNSKTKQKRNTTTKQHSCVRSPLQECRSIRSGASGLSYYCTPLVCISDVIGLPAVWRHNKPKTKNQHLWIRDNIDRRSLAQLWWTRAPAYGAMHQNQTQLRVKLWYIPKSTAKCGNLQPHRAGRHTQRIIVLPLSQTNQPHWAGGSTQRAIVLPLSQTNLSHWAGGAHPKGHCPSTLTNEPVSMDRGLNPNWQCPSTLTNESAPLGRGSSGAQRFGAFNIISVPWHSELKLPGSREKWCSRPRTLPSPPCQWSNPPACVDIHIPL